MINTHKITAIIPVHNWDKVSDNIKYLVNLKDIHKFKIIFILDSCPLYAENDLKELLLSTKNINFTVLNRDYNSAAESRNEGLSIVDTEWLCFWDSDDLPNLNEFYNLYTSVSSENVDLVVGQIRTSYLKNGLEIKSTTTKTSSHLTLALDLGFTRILYRSLFIKKLFFSKYKIGEDILFLAEIICKKPSIIFSQALVYNYLNSNWIINKTDTTLVCKLLQLYSRLVEAKSMQKDELVKGFYLLVTFKVLLSILKRVIFKNLRLSFTIVVYLIKLFTITNLYSLSKLLIKS
jgi:hypothetical protein